MYHMSALRVLKHEGCGRVFNKARGVAECFIESQDHSRVLQNT